jgi:hypothetical protein
MSDESTLLTDLEANEALAKQLNVASTIGDVVAHIQHVLWPYIRSVVEETIDIDEAVHDLVHETEDVLHPETAEVFAALVVGTQGLINHVLPSVDKDKDPKIYAGLMKLREIARRAGKVLDEIVMPEVDEEDDEHEGDDDGNDDDGAGDDGDAEDQDGEAVEGDQDGDDEDADE